jgi:hypothetical protein
LLVSARSKGCSKRTVCRGHVGDWTEARRVTSEGCRANCVVPELEAVLGKTHRTEFSGGRLETWVMVGLGTRSAIERAEIGNSQPKAVRARALPDRRRRAEHALARDREETESSPPLTTEG